MYLFFLFFFVFVSFSLISLILLQSGKGLNNTMNTNSRNNIKLFNRIGSDNFMTNIIGIFACFFLVISIILCNINNKIKDPDCFWESDQKSNIINKNVFSLHKKVLKKDIPD